jgi:hypothetical protein
MHWHLQALSMAWPKERANTTSILQHNSEDIEEAELDEGWDLNAAEDAPT